jgi:hypothetical protein
MASGVGEVRTAAVRLVGALGLGGVLLLVLPAGAGATDIYRWVDKSGVVHYSNVPVSGRAEEVPALGAPVEPLVRPDDEADAPATADGVPVAADGAPAAAGEPAAVAGRETSGGAAGAAPPQGFSTDMSLARSSLEQEYQQTTARLAEIDRSLEEQAAARERFEEHPSAAVGGVRAAGAGGVRSEEEQALEKEREAIEKRRARIRSRFADLRGKIVASYGGQVPAWWRDLQ